MPIPAPSISQSILIAGMRAQKLGLSACVLNLSRISFTPCLLAERREGKYMNWDASTLAIEPSLSSIPRLLKLKFSSVEMGKTTLISAALLALAQFTLGQIAPSATSSPPTATSSSAAATFTIAVGNNNQFQPDVTQTSVGDIIEFDFMPMNHSVVRAE
jgi:hypothetical protein